MLLRKFSITAIVALLFVPLASQKAQAATFTTQEINEIHNFQKEYYEYIYTFEKEDINEFKVKLEEVLGYNEEILINKGKKAKEYVMKEKNNVIQSKKIIEFITKNKS